MKIFEHLPHGLPPLKEASRDTFNPKNLLENSSNYKRYFYIQPDGSIVERVHLNIIDKRLREEVVLLHYLSFMVKHAVKSDIGINIISRDNPWDFELRASNDMHFNVEITSIADNDFQLQVHSREDFISKEAYGEQIRLRHLEKIETMFPNEELRVQIKQLRQSGKSLDELVDNPFFDKHERIFVSALPERVPLHETIIKAIKSKQSKKADDKSDTILLLDNRTSVLYVDEMSRALQECQGEIDASDFNEIWLYTGYCSDADGSNGQFTFMSLKVQPEIASKFDAEQ
jgi:hypothetical protein